MKRDPYGDGRMILRRPLGMYNILSWRNLTKQPLIFGYPGTKRDGYEDGWDGIYQRR
jgi:hypothetical protein